MTELTNAERFRKYHADNPHIADRLESMARAWFNAGNDRVSIGMLTEVLRWSHGLSDVSTDAPWKLSNTHRAHYARLLIERNPAWLNRFRTTELRTA